MKIECSFCSKEEASVFCIADEAPLCDICDRQLHHANNLARNHYRFSLIHHQHPPSCDICQDNRAIIFCKEDRAILCGECDVSIHKVNEHTRKHYRFLLTGVKLSTSASEYPSTPPSSSYKTTTTTTTDHHHHQQQQPNQTISDYLIKTLPGWRVDDFLNPSSSLSAFTEQVSPPSTTTAHFPDHGTVTQLNLSSFPYKDFVVWAPEEDTPHHFNHLPPSQQSNAVKKVNHRKRIDDAFTVPEITTSPLKKSRNIW